MNILLLFVLVTFTFFQPPSAAKTIDAEKFFLANLAPKQALENHQHKLQVNSVTELEKAIIYANQNGDTLITLAPSIYNIRQTLQITADNVSIVAASNNPFETVLQGRGMRETQGVDNLLRISGSDFLLEGITLQHVGNHLIQIAGENNANNPVIRNTVFQDGYQQLLKVTYDLNLPENYSRNGIIEHCFFRYTKSVGPNYYIGGIDAHGIQNWLIQKNVFKNIASPANHIAEHAIHLWNNTANNKVTGNLIINSDRGIGFGMKNGVSKQLRYGNFGGEISNNIIYHANNDHPFADVGVIVEESPNTVIENNTILLEHDYTYAIEYRFPLTTGVIIRNNTLNKGITTRNQAKGRLYGNNINRNLTLSDLHNLLN